MEVAAEITAGGVSARWTPHEDVPDAALEKVIAGADAVVEQVTHAPVVEPEPATDPEPEPALAPPVATDAPAPKRSPRMSILLCSFVHKTSARDARECRDAERSGRSRTR